MINVCVYYKVTMLNISQKLFPPKFKNILLNSHRAMNEIKAEHFNSKTLKELYSNKCFFSKNPDIVKVKSLYTGQPVSIGYKLTKSQNNNELFYRYELYEMESNIPRGLKTFGIDTISRQPKMYSGIMKSYYLDLAGIGIREDELQIKEALKKGIKSIPRISFPEAILYHIKMGFKPVEELEIIFSLKHLKEKMEKLMAENPILDRKLFTPIIKVKKTLLGRLFYFDKNSTISLANMRAVKKYLAKHPTENRAKVFISDNSNLILEGNELKKWKDMISGKLLKS